MKGSEVVQVKDAKFDEKYVMSSRVRTGRSIRGISLPPHCTRAERRRLEKVATEALSTLGGEFKGNYYSLEQMSEKEQEKLIEEHLLFDKPVSPLLTAARMARDWPDARGQLTHNHPSLFTSLFLYFNF